jgi:hypothetical protein
MNLVDQGWINFGYPGEQEAKLSPNSRLLVKMERFPTAKRVMYDAVLVEIAGLKYLSAMAIATGLI